MQNEDVIRIAEEKSRQIDEQQKKRKALLALAKDENKETEFDSDDE